MPYYEYQCRSCGAEFAVLVRRPREERPGCEGCGSADLRRLLSSFGVGGATRGDPGSLRRPADWVGRPEGFRQAMRTLADRADIKLDPKRIEGATERLRAAGED